MSFHDDAIRFMQELLVKLEEQATSSKSGTQVSQETADAVLLRLLGVLRRPEVKVGKEDAPSSDNNQSSSQQEQITNLVDNFLKAQLGTTSQDLRTMNVLLKAYRSRLTRYSKARTKIKLNRIKKFIDKPSKPLDPSKLLKSSPEDTRREVSTALSKLEEEGELNGFIPQQIAANQALASSIEKVTIKVPDDIGEFRNQLIGLLRANGKEAFDNIERLNTRKDAFQKEAFRLENMDKLLFEGQETFNGNIKLSLLKILDVLIFLTDRQQAKYNCSQCKFFQPGKTNACTFAPEGKTARTPSVTVTDDKGKQVTGRLTRPTNSCKDVWGQDNNEYYTPSDSIIQTLKNRLKDD